MYNIALFWKRGEEMKTKTQPVEAVEEKMPAEVAAFLTALHQMACRAGKKLPESFWRHAKHMQEPEASASGDSRKAD